MADQDLSDLLKSIAERTKSIRKITLNVKERVRSLEDIVSRSDARVNTPRDRRTFTSHSLDEIDEDEEAKEEFSLLNSLGDDLLRFALLPLLDSMQLVHVSMVNRRMRKAVQEPLWKAVLQRRWGASLTAITLRRLIAIAAEVNDDVNDEEDEEREKEEKGEAENSNDGGFRHRIEGTDQQQKTSVDSYKETKVDSEEELAVPSKKICLLLDGEWREALKVMRELPFGPFSLAGSQRRNLVLSSLRAIALSLRYVLKDRVPYRVEELQKEVLTVLRKILDLCKSENNLASIAALEVIAEIALFPSLSEGERSLVDDVAAKLLASTSTRVAQEAARAAIQLRGIRLSTDYQERAHDSLSESSLSPASTPSASLIDDRQSSTIFSRYLLLPDRESSWTALFMFPRLSSRCYEKKLVLSPVAVEQSQVAVVSEGHGERRGEAAPVGSVAVEGFADEEGGGLKTVEGTFSLYGNWGSGSLKIDRSENLFLTPAKEGWFGLWRVMNSKGLVFLSRTSAS